MKTKNKRNIKVWLRKNQFTDEQKLELLTRDKIKEYEFSNKEIVDIAISIKSDLYKSKVLKMASELGLRERNLCDIVASFNSDKEKREFIEQKQNKGYLISNLIKIIENFKYEKNRLEYILNAKKSRIYRPYLKRIIQTLRYENSRIKILENVNKLRLSTEDIAYIIDGFKYDSNKMPYLENEKIEELQLTRPDIVKIIAGMEKDFHKNKFLTKSEIKRLNLKKSNISLILSTFKDDELKKQYLANKTLKLPLLEQLKVISSYKDDQTKLDILKEINDGKLSKDESFKIVANLKILSSLKDTEKVVQYLKDDLGSLNVDKSMKDYKDLIALGIYRDEEQISKQQVQELEESLDIHRKKEPFKLPNGMTIGIELEAVGKSHQGTQNGVLLRKMRNLMGGYMAKRDTSLCGYDNGEGVEVVSPVLKDEDLETIPLVTELMKRNDLTTNDTCGGHIHVGADYLDSLEAWKNFFEIYNNCENIFYKISNKAGESPREGLGTYAKLLTNKLDIGKSISLLNESNLDSFIDRFKKMEMDSDSQYDRRYGINLTNINNLSKNTVEFRLFNGTLEHETILENIRLCTRLMEVSKQLGDIEIALRNKEKLSTQQKQLLKARQKLGMTFGSEEDLANSFLEMMFLDEKERKIYKERYEKFPKNQLLEEAQEQHPLGPLKLPFKQIGTERDTR